MCGIFCAVGDVKSTLSKELLLQATHRMSHRGPDALGYFDDGNCFMGHTRLAIIGTDIAGNQPYFFENFVLIFNGEIFNYLELMEELKALGYQFDGKTDTEVVIKAFHAWGPLCFSKFNGMWALVIYDKSNKELIVSRDRFGQKPLFILKKDDVIFFASEIQSLFDFSEKEINYGTIQNFLKEGTYQNNQLTFFKSIEIFPKAHYCEISKNQPVFHRFWSYWTGSLHKVTDRCFEDFSELLKDAVKIRLRADVPLGLLLSGGVDSTLIAGYCRDSLTPEQTMQSFTYSSNDQYDEVIYAKRVAEKLNFSLLVLHQVEEPSLFISRLKKLVKHLGQGHSSPAIVSIDYLYDAAYSQGIKVVIDGQGADELLGGYGQYHLYLLFSFFIQGEYKQMLHIVKALNKDGFLKNFIFIMRNELPECLKKIARLFYGYEGLFKNYKDKKTNTHVDIESRKKNQSVLNELLIKQHDVGLENLLYYGDICAMVNSVENRSPFLDHRLVEFAFSRRDKLKVWNGENKYALRKSPHYERFKDELDREKVGFYSPISTQIKIQMRQELQNSSILLWPIFSRRLPKFLKSERSMLLKYERILFRLYQVHLWHQIFYVDALEYA
jgi:asparagine synthase (glutamine-hydrolysing)